MSRLRYFIESPFTVFEHDVIVHEYTNSRWAKNEGQRPAQSVYLLKIQTHAWIHHNTLRSHYRTSWQWVHNWVNLLSLTTRSWYSLSRRRRRRNGPTHTEYILQRERVVRLRVRLHEEKKNLVEDTHEDASVPLLSKKWRGATTDPLGRNVKAGLTPHRI